MRQHDDVVRGLLRDVCAWAQSEPALEAVALVGSQARGDATPHSDVDLVVLTARVAELLEDRAWVARFGQVKRVEREQWGRVTSLRVWYANGQEVEFGLTTPDWATSPDAGTYRVVSDGIEVLWDPGGILARLR